MHLLMYIYIHVCVCTCTYKCVFKCIQVLLTWTSCPRIGLDVCGKQLSRALQLDEISCAANTCQPGGAGGSQEANPLLRNP